MEAGGEDNITVQFVRYGDDEANAAEIVADEETKRSGGARAWKIGGSLVAAVALGSAATFVYLNVWKPASLTGGMSATQPSNAAMLAGPRVSDHVDELQKQVRDLTIRVQKLEAAVIRPGSPKDAGDKPGSKGRAPRTGKDDKTSVPKGAGPNPAVPVSEGAPTGAEAGAGNPALSAPPPDQGARPPEPTPKTGDTKKEAGDTKKGDAEPRKQ